MPGREFESQVALGGKLQPKRNETLAEPARAQLLPRDYVGYMAGCGEGSTSRAHASAIQRVASGSPSLAANYLRQLQRSYGNRYVQSMLSQVGPPSAPQTQSAGIGSSAGTPVPKQSTRPITAGRLLQPKLKIGAPDDLYEKEADEAAERAVVQRKCACGGDPEGECAECRKKRLSVQRVSTGSTAGAEAPPIVDEVLASPGRPLDEVARQTLERGFGYDFSQVRIHDDSKAATSAAAVDALAYTVGNHIVFGDGQYQPGSSHGNRLLAHELTHTIQQTGGMAREIQRLSWDDVTSAVSNAEDKVEQEAEAAASAVASGAQAVGEAIQSGEQAVEGVVQSGAQAVGQAVGAGAEGLLDSAALAAANAIAGLFGGKVTVTPSGEIVITIPDQEIAEVENETFVLPLGIPTQTLFEAGFAVGPFVVDGWAGTIWGDPSITMAIGPVRLQNISLVLDPGAGTYLGNAQLYIGSAISGSLEKADEVKLQAEGVIPAEPPIPIIASAEVGKRAVFRLVGKEGFGDTVSVGYAGGSFVLREVFDVKLGAQANVDHEAFVRIEIEGEEICSVIWPQKPGPQKDAGVEIHVPVTIATGGGNPVTIGTPSADKFPADAIETNLQGDHEPEKCMGLEELTKFLCDKGIIPPGTCAILLPGKPAVGPPPTPSPVGPPGVLPPGPVTPSGPPVTPPGPVPPPGPAGINCGHPQPTPTVSYAQAGGPYDAHTVRIRQPGSDPNKHTKVADCSIGQLEDVISHPSKAKTQDLKDFVEAVKKRDTTYGSQLSSESMGGAYQNLVQDALAKGSSSGTAPSAFHHTSSRRVGVDVGSQKSTPGYGARVKPPGAASPDVRDAHIFPED